MRIRLSCPSCNSEFVLPGLPDSRRATCPRCGDVFPVRTYTEEAGGAAPPAHGEPEHASRTQGDGRRMVGVFAAALVLIALAGLPPFIVYYTRTKAKPHEPAATPTLTATPPAKLAALGYLRADCNVVFAAQPGPLLHYAARNKQEPRDVLAQAGLPTCCAARSSNSASRWRRSTTSPAVSPSVTATTPYDSRSCSC